MREVLLQEGTSANIVEIEVTDNVAAQQVSFLGSPTIRVDGQDVEIAAGAARAFGMMCRGYIDDGRLSGLPPLEWIRISVREAMRNENARVTRDA